jgi:hypothetical protein
MCVEPALNRTVRALKCSDRNGFDVAILCFRRSGVLSVVAAGHTGSVRVRGSSPLSSTIVE